MALFGQLIAFPPGPCARTLHVTPESTVFMVVSGATAKQTPGSTQLTALNPALDPVEICCQLDPDDVVLSISPAFPTVRQLVVLGQLMPRYCASCCPTLGESCGTQVVPPFVVAKIPAGPL